MSILNIVVLDTSDWMSKIRVDQSTERQHTARLSQMVRWYWFMISSSKLWICRLVEVRGVDYMTRYADKFKGFRLLLKVLLMGLWLMILRSRCFFVLVRNRGIAVKLEAAMSNLIFYHFLYCLCVPCEVVRGHLVCITNGSRSSARGKRVLLYDRA